MKGGSINANISLHWTRQSLRQNGHYGLCQDFTEQIDLWSSYSTDFESSEQGHVTQLSPPISETSPPSPPLPPEPKRGKRVYPVLREHDLRNSLARAKASPEYFCVVCCRLLFAEEVLLLEVGRSLQDLDLEQIEWPYLQYNKPASLKNGRRTCCKSHHTLTVKTIDYMRFINQHWGNPLRHQDGDGAWIVEDGFPNQLCELEWSDLPFICHVMTHSSFVKNTGRIVRFAHTRTTLRDENAHLFSRDNVRFDQADEDALFQGNYISLVAERAASPNFNTPVYNKTTPVPFAHSLTHPFLLHPCPVCSVLGRITVCEVQEIAGG
ncbi:hypothetical protein EDD21DRAFT_355241 [Dissophora ornata]|nr:hypothetical protein EDD21DRAFT_355241 [Dissophora ornata]